MRQDQLNPLLDQYKNIATSTIGHVLDDGFIPEIHAVNPVIHVCGRVRTVILNSINAQALRVALLESQTGDVLVIDARALGHRACWGEQRHRAAIVHQLAAVVVLGSVTDIDVLRKMKVPIFAKNVSCLTTRQEGESQVEFDQTIRFADTNIDTGDIMIGDADGVFILKPDIAAQYQKQFKNMQDIEQQKRDEFIQKYPISLYHHDF